MLKLSPDANNVPVGGVHGRGRKSAQHSCVDRSVISYCELGCMWKAGCKSFDFVATASEMDQVAQFHIGKPNRSITIQRHAIDTGAQVRGKPYLGQFGAVELVTPD